MKKVEAIIPVFKLGDIKEELQNSGVEELLVTEMKELVFAALHREFYRGALAFLDYRVAIKIEMICPLASVAAVKAAVARVACDGRSHPAILIVSDIERVFDF